MARVTVYRFRVYAIRPDQNRVSSRMATAKGVEMLHGEIIPETAVEIDEDRLERGEEWTVPNFVP